MKKYFVWPFINRILSKETEQYDFYNRSSERKDIKLVNTFEDPDYIFDMLTIYFI